MLTEDYILKVLAFKIFRRLENSLALKGMNGWKFAVHQIKKYENDIKAMGMWRNRKLGMAYSRWREMLLRKEDTGTYCTVLPFV